MKALTLVVLFAVAAVLAGTSTAAVRAQGAPQQAAPAAQPTPTPMDQHLYVDPGLEFHAPPEAYLAGRRVLPVAALGEDLEPVALWAIYPGKPEVRVLKIEMESFPNNPAQWEGQFESQMHGSADGLLFKNRTPMQLANGMPATFVEVTYGSGFDAKKEYAIVYADGSRGVVISVTGRIGEANAEEAKKWMQDAKAVRYPLDRDPQPNQ